MADEVAHALLDTSILIADADRLELGANQTAAISVITLGELRAGVALATSATARAARQARLAAIKAAFRPLPVDETIAEAYGDVLAAARSQQRMSKATDLLIIATARSTGRILYTLDHAQAQLAEAVGVPSRSRTGEDAVRTVNGSWELRFDVPEALHVALFIRDALRLDDASSGTQEPPELQGPVPDRALLLTATERKAARSAWQAWWLAVLTSPGSPDYSGTVPDGPLRPAADKLLSEARTWFYEHPLLPQAREGRDHRRSWELSRDAAEAAAAELGVDLSRLRAKIWLLLVEGAWWATPAQGNLFYSPTVADDERLLRELLRKAFVADRER